MCRASVNLSACRWRSSQSPTVCKYVTSSTSSEVSFDVLIWFFCVCLLCVYFFCPVLSLASLLRGWYVCQFPLVLEHLSSTSPPSVYQEAIFMLSRFHCALSVLAVIHIPNQLSLLLLLLFFFSFLLLLTSGCFEGKLSYSFSPHCHFCVMPAWLNRCCTLCCKCLDSTSAALVICWETSEPLHHEIKLATCMIWCHVIASCCHICSCAFCS